MGHELPQQELRPFLRLDCYAFDVGCFRRSTDLDSMLDDIELHFESDQRLNHTVVQVPRKTGSFHCTGSRTQTSPQVDVI